ncbi:RagB/SusD family nutrient uptake outer membrane protein [Algoriphagus boritolerans]|uniref:RagB/SusD family nutrient uptake outer membrane protein n=1 Tax=Algoriphagus boritolerans TaxID=308111 RepID=UPI002FCE39D8
MENDLKEALSLPDNYDDSNVGRATSFSARIVLAELYLWQKKWASAKPLLEDIINSGNFQLLDSYTSLFDGTTENHSETVFEIQYKANTGQPELGNFSTTYSAPNGEGYVPGGGWGWIRPTQDLVNEYELVPKEDPRLNYSIFRLGDDFEGQIFKDVVNGTGFAVKKWVISGRTGVEIEQNHPWYTSANFALYRYAEVLLMYAEVLNELGDPSEASRYINMVRARPSVSMPPISNHLTYDEIFEAIRHERRVEFAFEGKISFDLRRWGIAGEFLRSPDRWQNNVTINPQWGGNFFKFKDGQHEVFPIPQSEIDKSGGTLIQHPNW